MIGGLAGLVIGTLMIRNRLIAIAPRWSFLAVLADWMCASNAHGQSAAPAAINGVYNGSYRCAQGPTTLKLFLHASADGSLTGIFTFYLPPGSHNQAYSFSLSGPLDAATGKFRLSPDKWETPPPPNYSMVGMEGAFDPGNGQVAGKIASGACGAFQAKRGRSATMALEKEPAKTPAVSTASATPASRSDTGPGGQSTSATAPGVSTPTTAAAKPVTSSSSPAQAGTGGALVRKSKAYWDNYRSDIIRQVFDGGFGSDVDESTEFQVLFTSHVETFSKKCRAYLPTRHETVTVTQVTTRSDRYGNVVSRQNNQPVAVEVEPRFAPKYRKYAASLGSTSADSLRAAIGIMSGRVSANTYFDIGLDAARFFQTESCQSAAMSQLGENLLRGATGQLSLQQSGASIAGASAETDKSAPTGRFTRFIDGCDAFYRDPANARYRKLDSDAWCECLSDPYQHVMTPEQESYYANDYARHFRGEIAQPRESSTDPAWPRLHPAVERCAATTR
jgi:hypothetical protein